MRFRAMDPDASTTKMIREPAFRAMRFERTSDSSINTLRPMYFFCGFASCRSRRGFWYGADARIVASTANLLTLPRGNCALMYRPRSSEKIMPLPPDLPCFCLLAKASNSGSIGTPSASNINSSGNSGSSGSGSGASSWSSWSSWSGGSCCSSWSWSSSISSIWSWGGGGGGGGGGMSRSGGSSMSATNEERGTMANFTASLRSSASTAVLPASAAEALATSAA